MRNIQEKVKDNDKLFKIRFQDDRIEKPKEKVGEKQGGSRWAK